MSDCSNLCSAARCDELERRILNLDYKIQTLEFQLEGHRRSAIPEAHQYEQPDVDVSLTVDDTTNTLKLFVAVGDKNDSETVFLPQYDVDVALAVDSTNNTLKLFVAVGDKNDSETVTLPEHILDVGVDISTLGELTVTVQSGDQMVSDSKFLPEFDLTELIDLIRDLKDDVKDLVRDVIKDLIDEIIDGIVDLLTQKKGKLSINGSFYDNELTLTVADGQSQDTVQIHIPRRGGGGGGGDEPINLNIDGIFQDEKLYLTIAGGGGYDTTVIDLPIEIMEFSSIEVEEVSCVNGVASLELVSVAVIKGTEVAELKAYADRAAMLKAQCELEPIAAAPDWWQVRIGGDRPQIVCVFRKEDSRTYHSLTIPHPKNVELPSAPILPAYQKGNFQGMIVCKDNSKFIINCVSAIEAERMCTIAASKIISDYLPNPYKVWISERKGEAVGQSQMTPTSVLYYSTGQKNLKPDWRFAIPPDLEPI